MSSRNTTRYSSSNTPAASTTTGNLRRFPDGSERPADQPFCKVCYDAGLPVANYTDHFVKDQPGPNGKVVCPTLMNQACRICNTTGHTSSYCSQYRRRREEPRREEPRRDDRYQRDEPRRDDRYQRDEPRRDMSFNNLREDTEMREREIRDRDEKYAHQQDRNSKKWLQAATRSSSSVSVSSSHQPGYNGDNRNQNQQQRRSGAPYAHPHGPRVRLELESSALSASRHAAEPVIALPAIDVRKVNLQHAEIWGDEEPMQPFVCNPEEMFREFAQEYLMGELITEKEFDFIALCDDTNRNGNCFPEE